MVVKIDPTRLQDPEIAAEGERDRLKALAAAFSREDLMRSFDLLSRAEFEIRGSSQPRHHFEMALVKWIHLRKLTPLTEVIARFEGGAPAAARPQSPVVPPPAAAPPPAARPVVRPEAAQPPAPSAAAREPRNPRTPEPQNLRTPEPQNLRTPHRTPDPDPKSALLAAIREGNKTFFGMVIASAQSIEIEGEAIVFTFAPAHKGLRPQLEQAGWIEQLAQSATGRKLKMVARDAPAAPVIESAAAARAGAQKRRPPSPRASRAHGAGRARRVRRRDRRCGGNVRSEQRASVADAARATSR